MGSSTRNVIRPRFFPDDLAPMSQSEVANLIKRLKFLPTFLFKSNASYEEFLNKIHPRELIARKQGLWDVPHARLDMFVPSSRMSDVNEGALKGIMLK
ncbi:hypothetical protein Fmac_020630 [Flemingia macrophylla]|uniref:Cytokinin dehydrogenase 1 FAD/cytokinin binding domain-containing protein n=1 Tax=Flemingia macrophylla TaxID=520843 RepID=A0ABD1LUN2_9FABA